MSYYFSRVSSILRRAGLQEDVIFNIISDIEDLESQWESYGPLYLIKDSGMIARGLISQYNLDDNLYYNLKDAVEIVFNNNR